VPDAVAGKLKTTVHTPDTKDEETIVVPACMPVPDTDTPAPMDTLVVANVTLVELDVVVPTAVKTPMGANVVPVKGPNKGQVFVVFVMYCRF
jgi:hypothetical protein